MYSFYENWFFLSSSPFSNLWGGRKRGFPLEMPFWPGLPFQTELPSLFPQCLRILVQIFGVPKPLQQREALFPYLPRQLHGESEGSWTGPAPYGTQHMKLGSFHSCLQLSSVRDLYEGWGSAAGPLTTGQRLWGLN